MQDLNNAHWLASAVWELPHKRVCSQNKHLQLKFKLFTVLFYVCVLYSSERYSSIEIKH